MLDLATFADTFSRLGADAIQQAIDQLPPQFRTTVQLSDVEGLSYAEVAEATSTADELMLGSFAAPDFAEGVNSFLERREPHFAALVG